MNEPTDRSMIEIGSGTVAHVIDMHAGDFTDVVERAGLWEGDRLSMVYDFGMPSHYYRIVKEVYEPEEIDELLDDSDVVASTDTAAIIREKRP